MARRKPDPGAIYVSPRLQASLEPMGRCALTTVTVNWFLAAQPPGSAIRVSIYSDSLPALWESGRRAFRAAGLTVLEGFDCPTDPAATGLLVDTLCRELRRPEPWYLFVDDLHLLPDPRMARFLCELAARLPENVHLIAASRDRILSGDQVLRLGGRLHRIGAEQLRLEGGELAAYVHRCGAALDQEQLAGVENANINSGESGSEAEQEEEEEQQEQQETAQPQEEQQQTHHQERCVGEETLEDQDQPQQHRHQGEEDIQHLQDLFQQQRLRREGVKQQLEKGRQLPVLVFGQHQHGQQGRQHHRDHQDAHDPGRGQDVRVISIVVHQKPFFLSFIPIGWRRELPLLQGFRPV